ncbi:MAG: protein translocase subunit SecF [Proteobacteria bacterium]|nr:protein translocase subunit SecF [Pseudomonadota bacterium]
MFLLIKPHTNFDFMGTRYIWITVSAILILTSIILFFTKGLNYGVDFTGGIEMSVKFNDPAVDSQRLRTVMNEVKIEDLQIQKFSDSKYNEYLIRVKGINESLGQLTKDIETKLAERFEKDSYEVRKVDIIGPKVGKELKLSGIYSLIYAMLGIFIYIAIRFDYKFSTGAIVALVHDPLIIIGVFSITGYQFTLTTVAALLTVIGYSTNDTIVVYDRIRETMRMQKGTPYYNIINRAVNDTLSRTILTSVVTMLVVIMLLIFGGSTLWDFSLALTIGIVVGTYSSIFIASPIVLYMENLAEKKATVKATQATK